MTSTRVDPARLVAGLARGDRLDLARAITLVESRRPEDRRTAREVLSALPPRPVRSRRVGVTGPPGVGKSTLIESLGLEVLSRSARLAVLAIDPTSGRTGGSLLGDKTRMPRLSRHPDVFIRPSPSGDSIGGLAGATREAMLLVEAAGHDVVLVETVGVGQTARALEGLVDTFVLLVSADGGDEIQGVKRGVLELADVVAVTKADGEGEERARTMRATLEGALTLAPPAEPDWRTPVLAVSALEGRGVAELWDAVLAHRALLERGGRLEARRREQDCAWFARLVEEGGRRLLAADPDWTARRAELERVVGEGRSTALAASEEALAWLAGKIGG